METKVRGHGSTSFHDWLAASAYVKGEDQTARVVSRKKHRAKRNATPSDMDTARLELEQRVRVLWKLSNRHYRRWMNDRLLRELAPPLDAQEIGSLFAPPPWGERSVLRPFERVIGLGESAAEDIAAWEPFRNNVDMDVEAKALVQRPRLHGREENTRVSRRSAAVAAWQSIGHQSRAALRRSSSWHLVQLFEEKIIAFLREMQKGGSRLLVLEVNDAYHRLLLHGVCEFHQLSSQTVTGLEDKEGNVTLTAVTRVHVRKKKGFKVDLQEETLLSLLEFLSETKREVS